MAIKHHDGTATGEGKTILYLLDTLMEIAGSERNLFELTTRLRARGWHPLVVCMRGRNMVQQLREQGIEVHNLKLRRIYGFGAIAAALTLVRLIRRNKVALMVTYHESSDFFGSIVGKLAGVPVIISSRRDMGYSLKYRHILMYRLINRLFDRILTVSDAVKGIIADHQHVPWSRLITLYNGVDPALFEGSGAIDVRAAYGISADAPVVGIMAVIRPIKGHEFLLEAAARVTRTYPRAQFLLIGWISDMAYYERLKEIVKRLRLEHNVIFTGGISDRASAFSCMDISVSSSLNEGFSNAVIESMAAAKPVIATQSGGTAEAVIDGETGLLVPPQDSKALARAILQLMNDPEEARRMGKNGRRRVNRLFTVKRMILETESLYFELLDNKESNRVESLSFSPARLKTIAKRTAKQLAGNVLYYSGYTRLTAAGGMRILAYHRVTDNRFLLPGMGIRAGHFEEQMRYIRDRCTPIALEDALRIIRTRGDIPRRAVVVTFDDGYRDNYLNAYPVLKRYGIPATIFLSVGVVEQRDILWFDRITGLFRRTLMPLVDLTSLGFGIIRLHSMRARLNAAAKVVEFAKYMLREERDRMIESLAANLAVPFGALNNPPLMMNWEDVLAMKGHGVTFGSHGMSHTVFSRLSPQELEFEIGNSQRIIRERTGVDTRLFAYPNGDAKDLNRVAEKVLAKYDFDGGLTLEKGFNDCSLNPFTLRRVCVSEGMESDAFGHFSRPLFAAALSGALSK